LKKIRFLRVVAAVQRRRFHKSNRNGHLQRVVEMQRERREKTMKDEG